MRSQPNNDNKNDAKQYLKLPGLMTKNLYFSRREIMKVHFVTPKEPYFHVNRLPQAHFVCESV